MTCRTQDTSTHCPHCEVEPGQQCNSPSGKPQRMVHAQRLQLINELAHPGSGRCEADAAKYRQEYPDVEVRAVICAPSRAQVRWWSRWGKKMRYSQAAYEAEHGPDLSIPELPPGKEEDDFVGQSASEIMAQFDKVKVKRKG